MHRSFFAGAVILVLTLFFSCSWIKAEFTSAEKSNSREQFQPTLRVGDVGNDEFIVLLDGIAEVERSGGYYPGLAFTESGLREKARDYAGAVIAAYKELSFGYGYAQLTKDNIEETLSQTLASFENSGSSFDPAGKETALAAIRGVLAFSSENWEEASLYLGNFLSEDEEPDSFLRWMLLVCSLESDANPAKKRSERAAYGAIRARFSSFPEYWYRGARSYRFASSPATAGIPSGENISGIYAEQCINLSPGGPFAVECRNIIADGLGLSGSGEAIRSKGEIDETIRRSISAENPEILSELIPLITLPDNSYTNYAVGILKNLGSTQTYRKFFEREALSAKGRLAERLRYISRG